jgi:hypothetical protein
MNWNKFSFKYLLIAVLLLGISYLFITNKHNLEYELEVLEPQVFAAHQAPQVSIVLEHIDPEVIAVLSPTNLSIQDSSGRKVNDSFEIKIAAQGNALDLQFNPKKGTLKPGRYTVSGKIETPEGIRDFSQDFYWGVLALNTNKSVYLPGEEAYIQMAVLDDIGDTICGASLELRIMNQELGVNTKLTTDNNDIVKNPECGPNNVIDSPDYYGYYQLGEPGIYQLELTAVTRNGRRTIHDYIEVKETLPFEIERVGPTRIWPLANYQMEISVTALEDFQGIISEYVPESFKIISTQSEIGGHQKLAEDWLRNNYQSLVWPVSLQAGETYYLTYEFDAPDVSPEFYLLGPLELIEDPATDSGQVTFAESRSWQIASDDTTGPNSPSSNGTGSTCSGPTNVFASDDSDANCTNGEIVDADTYGFAITNGHSIDGIEVNIEWAVTPSTYRLDCQLLDASGLAVGDTKSTPNNSSTTDITDTLGSTSDTWSASLSESDVEDVDFGVRCTAVRISGSGGAQARIDHITITITHSGAANSAPTITTVADSPSYICQGCNVRFTLDWNDVDAGDVIKTKICKTNSLTSQVCDGGAWASTTEFTTADPDILNYQSVDADFGGQDYYAFVCDDEAACSGSTYGYFAIVTTTESFHVKSGTVQIKGGTVNIK